MDFAEPYWSAEQSQDEPLNNGCYLIVTVNRSSRQVWSFISVKNEKNQTTQAPSLIRQRSHKKLRKTTLETVCCIS